jgi:hypothetical protein
VIKIIKFDSKNIASEGVYWLNCIIFTSTFYLHMTNNFLMVQAPGFIRGINRKSQIPNPQAPELIRGVNPKSKIENRKSKIE